MSVAHLVLEDGTAFVGTAFGAKGEVVGELVVHSEMGGYEAALASQENRAKIIVFTLPELGNVGILEDSGKLQAAGVVAKHIALRPSHQEANRSLPSWLEEGGAPGIEGIDTRKLVRHLRDKGPMVGVISSVAGADPASLLERARRFRRDMDEFGTRGGGEEG